MSKKKGKRVESTTEDRHTSPRVVFHLPEEMLALIDRQAAENDRTRTGEILRALRTYYTSLGLWPPSGGAEGGGE